MRTSKTLPPFASPPGSASPDGNAYERRTSIPPRTPEVSRAPRAAQQGDDGLGHPETDDAIVASCKALSDQIQKRIQPAAPLREVPHPPDAETHLGPVTEFMIRTLREAPLDQRVLSLDATDLSRRMQQLARARRLLRCFTPLVGTLDLVVRNLEDGLDGDLRSAYWRLASLIDNDASFGQTFAPLKEWATLNGQRAARSRRNNLRRDAGRPEPSPAVTPAAPPSAPTPAPLSLSTAAPAAAPARRSRSRTRTRR